MNDNSTQAFAGKIALVTGGAQGIGASVAKLLAARGSAGIAQFPAHGGTVHDVMVKADAALYAAKNAGRNRAVHAGDLDGAADTRAA